MFKNALLISGTYFMPWPLFMTDKNWHMTLSCKEHIGLQESEAMGGISASSSGVAPSQVRCALSYGIDSGWFAWHCGIDANKRLWPASPKPSTPVLPAILSNRVAPEDEAGSIYRDPVNLFKNKYW